MKNLIGIILLIIVAVVAYFLLTEKGNRFSEKEDYKDFAIEDTASVDQFFISDPKGDDVLISRRKSGIWMVNNEFPAREDAVELILRTLHDVQIRSSVAQEGFDGTIKRLATTAKKVEFYTGGKKPEKIWYIGNATGNKLGTYMLLEKEGKKSSKPYITHLLMERGNLNTRFFPQANIWKERYFSQSNPQQIKSIEVKHTYDTATSFLIEQVKQGEFKLTNLKTNDGRTISTDIAVPFFKNFEDVYYEYIDNNTPKEKLDSIYNSPPRHEIILEMMDGSITEIKTFKMPVIAGSTLGGKPIYFHPERMYSYSSQMDGEVYPVVQNYAFDKLIPTLEQFTSSTTVEK